MLQQLNPPTHHQIQWRGLRSHHVEATQAHQPLGELLDRYSRRKQQRVLRHPHTLPLPTTQVLWLLKARRHLHHRQGREESVDRKSRPAATIATPKHPKGSWRCRCMEMASLRSLRLMTKPRCFVTGSPSRSVSSKPLTSNEKRRKGMVGDAIFPELLTKQFLAA